MTDKFVS